jgi:uncharacterized protein (DUF433 family)
MVNFKNYISIDSTIRFGRPCITGTRISVYDVLSWLANGMSEKEIIEDFPELTSNHIKACLAYAANKESKIRVA